MELVKRKIGQNRNNPRLWLEGKTLESAGWVKGTRYEVEWGEGYLIYRKAKDGARKVAGAEGRPIIDTNNAKLLCLGIVGEMVDVDISGPSIIITPANRP